MFSRPTFRLRIQHLLALALLLGFTAGARAELPTPMLVADAAPGFAPLELSPGSITEAGGRLYFDGRDPLHGQEPWVSDGTEAGSHMLADVCPGTCDSYSNQFTALGERVVFASYSNDALYAIEGDAVIEIARGLAFPRDFARLGDVLYFNAGNPGHFEMWRTDGTADGTFITTNFCTTDPCRAPYSYADLNGLIYFTSDDGRVFVLDTAETPRAIGPQGIFGTSFIALDTERVLFRGCNSGTCVAWVSDGTAAGTFSLEAPISHNSADRLVAWRGRVYFTNLNHQVYSTDGTIAGTRLETGFVGAEITLLGSNSSTLFYDQIGSFLGDLSHYLHGLSASGSDQVFYGPSLRFLPHSPRNRVGEKLYFSEGFANLVVSDGSLAGTRSLSSEGEPGTPFRGLYYYGLQLGLWHTDGTVAGTVEVPFSRVGPNGSNFSPFRLGSSLLVSRLYGSSDDPNLSFVDPQTFVSTVADPRHLEFEAVGKNVLYASVTHDGSGSQQLVALRPSGTTELGTFFIEHAAITSDDHLIFSDARPGQELIESDGTVAGTEERIDLDDDYVTICSGHHCTPEYPQWLTPSGDKVFFGAFAGDHEALWVWQRGQATAQELMPLDLFRANLHAAPGGKVVFVAISNPPGIYKSLWVSDGTPAGTRFLTALPGGSDDPRVVTAGNRIFFTPNGGVGLWVSDLTEAGTYQLLSGVSIDSLVAAGDHVFFTGNKSTHEGREPGFSDGTAAGTRWLELVAGPQGSFPSEPFVLDDQRVVFAAAADEAGYELWISDGTLAGSSRLTDLAPGAAASSPRYFAQVGNRLFFEAGNEEVGQELWALDLPAAPAACPADRLCLQNGRFEVEVTVTANGQTYAGQRVLATAESGVFRFFSADNWELLVKVLDGCAINQAFWVYSSAATDLPLTLKVHDRAAGTSKTYTTVAGPARPILDGSAFATCALAPVPAAYSPAATAAPAASRCTDDPSTLCLGPNGRYRVRLDWQTATASGQALPVADGSADSGLFTFFSPSNWEMMVKLLDGCSLNNKRWVYAAGTTDVAWTLTVTDRNSGAFKTYHNNLGEPSKTITDSSAFACD